MAGSERPEPWASAPARRLTRREAQGAASRERILQAASALMADRGFAGTSISAVSRRSGLPASSIYWHFESKEGLLGAVVEDGARRWFEGLPRWEGVSGSARERVEAIFEATARSLESRPEFLRLLLLIALERRDIDARSLEAIRRTRAMALGRLRQVVGTLLAPAGAAVSEKLADELSMLALVVADGVFIQHHIDPERTDVEGLFRLLGRALRALGAQVFDGD